MLILEIAAGIYISVSIIKFLKWLPEYFQDLQDKQDLRKIEFDLEVKQRRDLDEAARKA